MITTGAPGVGMPPPGTMPPGTMPPGAMPPGAYGAAPPQPTGYMGQPQPGYPGYGM